MTKSDAMAAAISAIPAAANAARRSPRVPVRSDTIERQPPQNGGGRGMVAARPVFLAPRHRAQMLERAPVAQLAHDGLHEAVAVEHTAVRDGRDVCPFALNEAGHRLIDRLGGKQ